MVSKENIHKTALVTGASSGIGREYARQLAGMGYNLLLVSNEEEQIRKVSKELASQYGVHATPLCMDLAQPGAAGQLYDYCREQGIEIEILINNAGIFSFSDVADTPCSLLESMNILHVVTPTLLCRYFGEAMRQKRKGYILNMSSLSARTPFPGIATYTASKAYLATFSRAFHAEMKPYNVGVTAIAPGAVATNLYRLSDKLQKLGIRLGIITPAPQFAKTALRYMFKRRNVVYPGFINRMFVAIFPLIPEFIRRSSKNKLSKYEW